MADAPTDIRSRDAAGTLLEADVLFARPPEDPQPRLRIGPSPRLSPQVEFAQLAALLRPDYRVDVLDAVALGMGWREFEEFLRSERPRYYVTAPHPLTLRADMRGVFLARSFGCVTVAFGPDLGPLARETLSDYPSLDYLVVGDPELTLRELLDTLEVVRGRWYVAAGERLYDVRTRKESAHGPLFWKLWRENDPDWQPAWTVSTPHVSAREAPPWLEAAMERRSEDPVRHPPLAQLASIKGLAWRAGEDVVVNPERPPLASLDDFPLPAQDLLPLPRQRIPIFRDCYTLVEVSRSGRRKSPPRVAEEVRQCRSLGLAYVAFLGDFAAGDEAWLAETCALLRERVADVTWACEGRVDACDPERVRELGRAGCRWIVWPFETRAVARERALALHAKRTLAAAALAGIRNWGHFVVGLPGDGEASVRLALEECEALDFLSFSRVRRSAPRELVFEEARNLWLRRPGRWPLGEDEALPSPLEAELWARQALRRWALRHPGRLSGAAEGIGGRVRLLAALLEQALVR